MRAGDAALAAHRVSERHRDELRQRLERRLGARQMDPAAGQHQRPLGFCQQSRGALDVVAGGPGAPRRDRERCRIDGEFLGCELVLAVTNVLRHVEQHGAGPPRRRNRKRAAHQLGNALGRFEPDQLLDGRPKDVRLPAFLRHVLPRVGAVGVAGDRQHRRAGIERLDEPGDEIGSARPQRAVANAGPVGHPRVGVGRKRARALVVDQMMGQSELADRVVERKQLKAAHAEHRSDAGEAQHFGERAPAAH